MTTVTTAARPRPADEETPLLRPAHDKKPKPAEETPLPWAQFSIVLFLQLAEPLTSQVIYPFVPQLIREIGITNGDETKVGYYVGMMQSIFFATQALTVLHWSRASDRIGRKPVILIGLLGLSLSMYCFGLSRSFWGLVLSRSLNGALNGNIGVIKSMMAEMTDETNLARAFAYQPIPWSTGATVGPLIGGALSRPAERFPGLFGNSDFLKTYPYFLPCAIPATFSVLAWIVTYMFLKETNITGFSFRALLPRWRSRSRSSNPLKLDPSSPSTLPPPSPPLRSLLTRPVLLSISAYALLSLLDIAYRALQPVFYSTPRALGGLGLEPHAIGNALAVLGLSNGVFQAFCFARMIKAWGVRKTYLVGIASAAPIFACFPAMSAVVRMEDRAALQTREEPALSAPLLVMLAFQLALTLPLNTCYGCCFMYITGAASAPPSRPAPRPPMLSSSSSVTLVASAVPSRVSLKQSAKPAGAKKGGKSSTLGAVNGLAQCTVSVMRCMGPYAASALFARGLAWEYGGSDGDDDGGWELGGAWRRAGGALVYAVMVALTGITLALGTSLPEGGWGSAREEEEDCAGVQDADEER
ncbi:MFS general substrate transporter [Phellopilus nigrolimitatus]|nr:MFS general substrate transporter [Phellopilus nigrolimitatus]